MVILSDDVKFLVNDNRGEISVRTSFGMKCHDVCKLFFKWFRNIYFYIYVTYGDYIYR